MVSQSIVALTQHNLALVALQAPRIGASNFLFKLLCNFIDFEASIVDLILDLGEDSGWLLSFQRARCHSH